jgi:hypothetical protein
MGNRRKLSDSFQGAQPFEVDVQEAVGTGQQASRFRGCTAAKLDNRDKGGCDQQDRDRDGESASEAHREASMIALEEAGWGRVSGAGGT